MGCRFSSVKAKPKERAPLPKSSLKSGRAPPHGDVVPVGSNLKESANRDAIVSPNGLSPQSPIKQQPYAHDLASTDENALDDDVSNTFSPSYTGKGQQPVDDDNDASGSSCADLNGSFANVDLNGSFHIHYNTKGDIIPNSTLPEGRRARSVSPKLLAALSPHPSDDELVLVCTDCGMTIDEKCEPLCPLTGKLHI
jgi:hypothetical protein